jgi:hypothetical protein
VILTPEGLKVRSVKLRATVEDLDLLTSSSGVPLKMGRGRKIMIMKNHQTMRRQMLWSLSYSG